MSWIRKDWDCYKFGIKTGINSILSGHYLIGTKQLFFPISYWRFPIFNIALDNIEREKSIRILDIGSPKLLSLYLAIEYGHIVHATDLQDQEIFNRFQKHFSDHKSREKWKYIVEFQDARSLKYPDEYFDIVYSISVLEHIPDDGDKEAVNEIQRVLKRKGKAIIEVPFAKIAVDEYLKTDVYDRKYLSKPVFYQRQYDKNTIVSRLIDESKMDLVNMIITIETIPFEKYWSFVPKYLRIPFLWLEPFVSSLNHFSSTLKSWHEIEKKAFEKKAMNATLILRKNRVI